MLQVNLYLLDGGQEYRETMGEAGETGVKMTQWMLSHAAGRKPYTPAECFKLNAEREAFRTKIMAHWNATRSSTSSGRPVDAILTPVFPSLAPAHGTTRWWGYSSYWSVLNSLFSPDHTIFKFSNFPNFPFLISHFPFSHFLKC